MTNLLVVISTYCNVGGSTGPASTLANANSPTPQITINAVTTFTCNSGYQSYRLGNPPYYECLNGGSSVGIWSSTYFSCICTQK